jgi:cell division septum initiation protein DivIVA
MRPTIEIATDYEGLRQRLEALREELNNAKIEASECGEYGEQFGYWRAKARHHARNSAHHALQARRQAHQIEHYLDYYRKGES